MESVAGNCKMCLRKFTDLLAPLLALVWALPAVATDVEVRSVRSRLEGHFDGRMPMLIVDLEFESRASQPIWRPTGWIIVQSESAELTRELTNLIEKVEPGHRVSVGRTLQANHQWATSTPTLEFELHDYKVLESLDSLRFRLEGGARLAEAVVTASLGASGDWCKWWSRPGAFDNAKRRIEGRSEYFMPQAEGFLRIALLLGARHCAGDRASEISLEGVTRRALEEVLQVLVTNVDATMHKVSPLAQSLPPKTQTLEDLFELALPELTVPTREVKLAPTEEAPTREVADKGGRVGIIVLGITVLLVLLGFWMRRSSK